MGYSPRTYESCVEDQVVQHVAGPGYGAKGMGFRV